MRSLARVARMAALLALSSAAQAQLAPGDLLLADFDRGVFNIRAGGDFSAAAAYASGLDGADGICIGPGGHLYAGEYDAGEVTIVTAGGDFTGAAAFASGLGCPISLLCTPTQILVADNCSGSVFDITAGGDFSAAVPFATGLGDLGNIFRDAGGTLWSVAIFGGVVHDFTAGGDFGAATPFVSGGSGLIDLEEFGGALLLSEFGDDEVLDTAGGGPAAGLSTFAMVPAARGLENVPGLGFFATSANEVWEISAGGDFTAATPFASGFSFSDVGSMVYVEGCGDGIVQAGIGETCDDGNTADGDGCNAACQVGFCTAAPSGSCADAAKASLAITEKKPGKEKWKLSLEKFDAPVALGDLGDPVAGATAYRACLYDEADALTAELRVDRAGALCGPKPCWRAKGTRGYAYKDREASADGVRKISARAGEAGKGKLTLQAANHQRKGQTDLPTGVSAALAGQSQAVVQVVTSDAGCVQGVLGDVKKAEADRFKAKAP